MKIFKATGTKDFYRVFMSVQSIKYDFNQREIAIGAEFLFYRNYYVKNPIKGLDIDKEGNEIEVKLDLIAQLKDPRTLKNIMKDLDMSIVILRKHVKGLKLKEFFKEGDVNKDFITDGISVAFNIST